MRQTQEYHLFDSDGQRLYLTPEERGAFEQASKTLPRLKRSYCLLLKETGMRRAEALSLTPSSFDLSAKCVTVETLKRRRKGIFRQIPLSDDFIDQLDLVHQIREKQNHKDRSKEKLWNISTRTATRWVSETMKMADIHGSQACPKGLRHAFCVACVLNKVPLPTIQKWAGHASMETTAIYLQVTGDEERQLANMLWTGNDA